MREIHPCRTPEEARTAIDNGGRFYNLVSRAGDRVVTMSELEKAAGLHWAGVEAFLFLDMFLAGLEEPERRNVVALLEPGLRARYEANRPRVLSPGDLDAHRDTDRTVVVEGWLSQAAVSPEPQPAVVVDMVTSMAVPMGAPHRFYDIARAPGESPAGTRVAVGGDRKDLDGCQVRLGGVCRPIHLDEAGGESTFYLQPRFFTLLSARGARAAAT